MLYIHECTNHLFFGNSNHLTDDRTTLYVHILLRALFMNIEYSYILILNVRVKLKSVRREHGKTAVRPGKFVLLTYSHATSHQTAVLLLY